MKVKDIKAEVSAIISLISNGTDTMCYLADDYSFVQIGWDNMSWGEFKKLLKKYLK